MNSNATSPQPNSQPGSRAPRKRLGWLLALCGLSLLLPRAGSAANANPPDRMTYQGYLVDANGNALGNTNTGPRNYDVIFRIWNDQSASATANRLWSEQQTVTVDKGYFSVLLGEGSPYSTELHPPLSSLFAQSDSSDRFVEITVKGIGASGADVVILPRLRLVTSPYAYLAQKATGAVSLINNSNLAVLSVTGTNLSIGGNLTASNLTVVGSVTAASLAGNGLNITAINGTNINDGTVNAAELGANSVTTVKIADGAVTSAKLADGSVATTDLADGSVTAAKLNSTVGVWANNIGNFSYTGGNVGIGVASPAAKLDISGAATALQVSSTAYSVATVDGSSTAGTWLNLHNTTAGNTYWHFLMTGTGNGTGAGKLLLGSGGPGSLNGAIMTFSTNGAVGIGTTSPLNAALEVDSTLPFNLTTTYGYLSSATTPTGRSTSSGIQPFSIYAGGRIAGTEINAFSDARIKQVIGRSDSLEDLKTLAGIEITDYTMVDKLAAGDRAHKKVIAQQVERVFPEAVSKANGVVPDIYTRAEARAGWIPLAKPPVPALKVGDQVRLITEQSTALHEITEVSDKGFRVKEPLDGSVFVYGRQVNDFRTVDYDAIAMLNVSATQELYRELQTQMAEVERLRREMDALKARDAAQTARFDKLEQIVKRLNVPAQTVSLR